MNRKYKENFYCLITSNILQKIYGVFGKFIKYDLSKRLKLLKLFDLIIERGKEFHNFSPWYKMVNFLFLFCRHEDGMTRYI